MYLIELRAVKSLLVEWQGIRQSWELYGEAQEKCKVSD